MTQTSISPPCLLLIDDDLPIRESIAIHLENRGFQVFRASGGEDGIEQFERHKPDLVLTDLRMPDLNGLEVIRRLKKLDSETPIIVVSGAGVMDDVIESMRLGAVDYISKPIVDMEMFEHIVRRGLKQAALQHENIRYSEELEAANKDLSRKLGLLRQDQRAGREAQQRMMPPSPMTYGAYNLGHRIIPSLFLSGDLVDHRLINDRYLLVSLLDVSGHGAAAAFVTVLVRHWIRDYVDHHGIDTVENFPAAIVGSIHEHLYELNLDHHATGFIGLFDIQDNSFHYVVAGHLPFPIIINRQGARWLENSGPPMGLFPGAQWTTLSTEIPPGDRLLVFSDGILEVLEGTVPEREDKLIAELEKGGKYVRDWLSLLEQGPELPDDIAVLDIYRERGRG